MTVARSASAADVRRWAIEAARAADAKQADHVVILDVNEVLGITDYFVICSARNDRLVKTVAETIGERMKDIEGPKPLRIEGLAEAHWVLMDYADFVVHVFSTDARGFYDLERLWRDVPRVEWEDVGSGVRRAVSD
jgi:ribosome-associated protein